MAFTKTIEVKYCRVYPYLGSVVTAEVAETLEVTFSVVNISTDGDASAVVTYSIVIPDAVSVGYASLAFTYDSTTSLVEAAEAAIAARY